MSAPTVHPNARLLSVAQVAREFGIGATTLKALIKSGKVPTVAIPGVRKKFIDRRDLERLVERTWKEKALETA